MPTAKLNSKRIQSITIKRMVDECPDTSWLGEYSDKPTSEYSIDRAHDLSCPVNTGITPLDAKTRTAINAETGALCECVDAGCAHHSGHAMCHNKSATILYRVDMDDASGTLMCSDCADEATTSGLFTEADDPELQEPQCDCGGHGDMERNQYQYFNPSFNYVDAQGKLLGGNTDEYVRKYVRQDYERMESLNRGDWYFVGIRAEAKIVISGVYQTITSGGLWGSESDSDSSYFAEVEAEQLSELKDTLACIGFSKRAIASCDEEHCTKGW